MPNFSESLFVFDFPLAFFQQALAAEQNNYIALIYPSRKTKFIIDIPFLEIFPIFVGSVGNFANKYENFFISGHIPTLFLIS
jgi:hypothetical protein